MTTSRPRPLSWQAASPLAALAGLTLALLTAAPARGDEPPPEQYIYQYTDDQGVVHIVDQLELVPEAYRNDRQMRRVSTGRQPAGEGPPPVREDPEIDDIPVQHADIGRRRGPSAQEQLERQLREPPSSELLETLRARREEVMIRISLLEEGYAEDADPPPGDDVLAEQLDQLKRSLEQLDHRIQALERASQSE